MIAAYDAIAEWYDQSVRSRTLLSSDDQFTNAVFAPLGDLHGQRVCDLACGQGHLARQLARRGALVTGIDLSQNLLAIAQQDEDQQPLGITYQHGDAQTLPPPAVPFDGVLCHMALMDIPDLAATFASVHRLLRPGGWFVFTITHPCFQIPPGHPYAQEGFWRSDNPSGVRGQVGAHHRTLSTYLNTLVASGLILEHLTEPTLPDRPTPALLIAHCHRTVA